MNNKNGEFEILKTIGSQLEIDSEGKIWRIGVKTGLSTGGTKITKNARRRAESRPGRYLQMRAMHNGHRFHAYAHRVVWIYFRGAIPDGLQINHINGNGEDNRLENLELVTPRENIGHAIHILKRHPSLRKITGELNPSSKITDAQRMEIRARRKNGEKLVPLAKEFGICFQRVSSICRSNS